MKLALILSIFNLFCLASSQWDPNFSSDGRSTIVHLFQWRWIDIAEECERFLGPKGFGGVQLSPVNENAVVTYPHRPWSERYVPVSYNVLTTRSGNEEELKDMVRRCNAVGVRIYVDVVLNHMTHHDMCCDGTGGSKYNGKERQFPEFSAPDFNDASTCPSQSGEIEDWSNPIEIKNCELWGLLDLNQGKPYVRDHIAYFLNKLISFGG